jgi:putative NIF3 family GTP cyclohydrolase 1 type 2
MRTIPAGAIVTRLRDHFPASLPHDTWDTLKSGHEQSPVRGVAVTFLATLDVLRRSVELDANFVITHEPTFYHGSDDTRELEGDVVLEIKRRFIEEHELSVFRLHDALHALDPDRIARAFVEAIGWQSFRVGGQHHRFVVPETSLRELCQELKAKTGASAVRAVGDPEMRCTKIGLNPGAPYSIVQMRSLQDDAVQVLIAGETREWETVEYARDAVTAGRDKALILLGHRSSEEPAMERLALEIAEIVPEVPVSFVPAGEPYWSA